MRANVIDEVTMREDVLKKLHTIAKQCLTFVVFHLLITKKILSLIASFAAKMCAAEFLSSHSIVMTFSRDMQHH